MKVSSLLLLSLAFVSSLSQCKALYYPPATRKHNYYPPPNYSYYRSFRGKINPRFASRSGSSGVDDSLVGSPSPHHQQEGAEVGGSGHRRCLTEMETLDLRSCLPSQKLTCKDVKVTHDLVCRTAVDVVCRRRKRSHGSNGQVEKGNPMDGTDGRLGRILFASSDLKNRCEAFERKLCSKVPVFHEMPLEKCVAVDVNVCKTYSVSVPKTVCVVSAHEGRGGVERVQGGKVQVGTATAHLVQSEEGGNYGGTFELVSDSSSDGSGAAPETSERSGTTHLGWPHYH